MTCGETVGARLVFENSGVEIIPWDVSFESSRKKYRHARVTLSREAGVHINDNAQIPEPVKLYANDTLLARLHIPLDAIRLMDNEASLHLLDPRKSLEGHQIDYKNSNAVLGDVVDKFREWIMDTHQEKVNPNGLIKAVRPVEKELLEERSRSWDDRVDTMVGPVVGPNVGAGIVKNASEWPVLRDIQQFALSTIDNWGGGLGEDGGLDFQNISIAQALKQVEARFSIGTWVDDDGVLWFGPYESQPNLYSVGQGNYSWTLAEYNITEDPVPVTQSYVRGDYAFRHKENLIDAQGEYDEIPEKTKVRMWGFAALQDVSSGGDFYNTDYGVVTADEYKELTGEFPDSGKAVSTEGLQGFRPPLEGETIMTEAQTKVPAQLERIARRQLLDSIHDHKAGSLKVNPVSSPTKYGDPARAEVGDIIAAFPDFERDCNEGPRMPGAFTVNTVRHTLDSSNGWMLDLEVGQVPTAPVVAGSYPINLNYSKSLGSGSEEFYGEVEEETQNKNWVDSLSSATQDAMGPLIDATTRIWL